jgi:hypothetical protein
VAPALAAAPLQSCSNKERALALDATVKSVMKACECHALRAGQDLDLELACSEKLQRKTTQLQD